MSENKVSCDVHIIRQGAPFAALSYVAFLSILTFIFKKDNDFALFHARQGLVLFFAKFICFIMPILPFVNRGLVRFCFFILILASLFGIYCALSGKSREIPVIGVITRRFVI